MKYMRFILFLVLLYQPLTYGMAPLIPHRSLMNIKGPRNVAIIGGLAAIGGLVGGVIARKALIQRKKQQKPMSRGEYLRRHSLLALATLSSIAGSLVALFGSAVCSVNSQASQESRREVASYLARQLDILQGPEGGQDRVLSNTMRFVSAEPLEAVRGLKEVLAARNVDHPSEAAVGLGNILSGHERLPVSFVSNSEFEINRILSGDTTLGVHSGVAAAENLGVTQTLKTIARRQSIFDLCRRAQNLSFDVRNAMLGRIESLTSDGVIKTGSRCILLPESYGYDSPGAKYLLAIGHPAGKDIIEKIITLLQNFSPAVAGDAALLLSLYSNEANPRVYEWLIPHVPLLVNKLQTLQYAGLGSCLRDIIWNGGAAARAAFTPEVCTRLKETEEGRTVSQRLEGHR